MTDSGIIPIDICLCTFRRPHVADTLRSLSQLITKPEWVVHIIVADNDETPSAQETVEEAAKAVGLYVTYIHAPARNISVARNACLEASTAPLIAFLDDDELATPEWLAVLLSTLHAGNADIVLGPVQALYPATAPRWMKKGDFHATRPVWVDNHIITGYTCNVLMKREAIGSLRFRPELGRSGGEDTAFFASLHRAGKRIAYAPEAWLTEQVTPERAKFSWLFRRRFRSGQTHALLLLEHSPGRAKHLLKTTAKMGVCFSMALLSTAVPVRQRFWLLRGAVHLGAVSRLLGKQEITQYG
ncbi:MAG: glycosyltransferase [Rickettsiales bacterium]|nr:glycosyltransferase [Rickettsiales bacterium]